MIDLERIVVLLIDVDLTPRSPLEFYVFHCIINANRASAYSTTFVYIPSSLTDSSAAHVNRLILTAEFEFNVDLVEFVIIEIFTFFLISCISTPLTPIF